MDYINDETARRQRRWMRAINGTLAFDRGCSGCFVAALVLGGGTLLILILLASLMRLFGLA